MSTSESADCQTCDQRLTCIFHSPFRIWFDRTPQAALRLCAGVAELVDAPDLGSGAYGVGVRVPSPAPKALPKEDAATSGSIECGSCSVGAMRASVSRFVCSPAPNALPKEDAETSRSIECGSRTVKRFTGFRGKMAFAPCVTRCAGVAGGARQVGSKDRGQSAAAHR